MAFFYYKAVDYAGHKHKALLDASTREDLIRELESAGLYVVRIYRIPIFIYYLVKNGKLEEGFRLFNKNREMLRKAYSSLPVVKAAISSLMERAIVEEKYGEAYAVSRELVDNGHLDCYTGSILVISGVRLGKLKEVSDVLEKIKGCRDRISRLARTVYSDAKLEEVLKSGEAF